ncbi:MAG: DUF1697 domain-containing protein [Bryobacteraceae bacterium]
MATRKNNTTHRFVAFLGGINVGGHRVKMADLCELFTGMGFQDPSTFIASGNVLFSAGAKMFHGDAAELERRIEARLEEALGYRVPTYLRTPAEVVAAAEFQAFPAAGMDAPGHRLHVCFLRRALSREEEKVLFSFETEMDAFRLHERQLYWLCRGNSMESLVKWPVLTRRLGVTSTARNITMLRKLAPICSA